MNGELFWGHEPKLLIIYGEILLHVENSLPAPYYQLF